MLGVALVLVASVAFVRNAPDEAQAAAAPADANLAFGQPTRSSSVYRNQDRFESAGAVDGDRRTRWSSDYADDQWIEVNLGDVYEIDKVIVQWEVAHATSYRISISTDQETWVDIYSTTGADGGWDEIEGLSGAGRYLRVHGTDRATPWGISIWHLAVYGTEYENPEVPTIEVSTVVSPSTITSSGPTTGPSIDTSPIGESTSDVEPTAPTSTTPAPTIKAPPSTTRVRTPESPAPESPTPEPSTSITHATTTVTSTATTRAPAGRIAPAPDLAPAVTPAVNGIVSEPGLVGLGRPASELPAGTTVRCLASHTDPERSYAAVRAVGCESGDADRLFFRHVDEGYGQMVFETSGLCLRAGHDGDRNGSLVYQDTCATTDQFLWAPHQGTVIGHLERLGNKWSRMCLHYNSTDDRIELRHCNHRDTAQVLHAEELEPMMQVGGPEVPPVDATYHGVLEMTFFGGDTGKQDVWTHGDVALSIPEGRITQEIANQWLAWYVRIDDLYRTMYGWDDARYERRTRAVHHEAIGRKRLIQVVSGRTCGYGCGNGSKAEVVGHHLKVMLDDPTDWGSHWVLFYEMGRGVTAEPSWHTRAQWPSGRPVMPGLQAGLAFHELGGDSALWRSTVGSVWAGAEEWADDDREYVDAFRDEPYGPNVGILFEVLHETDAATIERIYRNMERKEPATSIEMAMCDFKDIVNQATGSRFNGKLIGPWGMPHDC